MLLPLLSVALLALAAAAVAPPTHSYTFHSKERPPAGAFIVDEGIPGDSLAYCFNKCDSLASQHQPNTTCAGFTLINATGAYLCAYYHSGTNLAPPNPPEKALVGFYAQSAKPAPAPAPAPPLPPPPAPPPPTPPAPRAPDQFTATLLTDVGTNEKIVLNLRRSDAPHGVDQFHRLAKIGFFNDSAFFRYAPGLLVEWGVSGNASLNAEYAHTPIPGDPTGVKSNLRGTVSFADGGMGRASVIFINFGNNSHLDTHIVPFATVAGKESMKTAEDIFDPTPDSANGVPPKAYADNGNAWIRKTYPGINFITGVTLSE